MNIPKEMRKVSVLGKNQMPVAVTQKEEKQSGWKMALEAIVLSAIAAGGLYGMYKAYESGERNMRERQGIEEPEEGKKPTRTNYKTTTFKEDSDYILLARMLFGEARNCSESEKIAVAYSALNRVHDGKTWNGTDIKSVILCPSQYSCFNSNDPNRKQLMNPQKYDPRSWLECIRVAKGVLGGKYEDPTNGATHYHTLSCNPAWASSSKMKPIGRVGNSAHTFYRER